MERNPPTPICRCFVLCRQLFVDPDRQSYTLVTPVYQVFPPRYPVAEDLSVYARWTNSHGSYAVELQLRDLEGNVLWRGEMGERFETSDPLQVWQVALRHLNVVIPRPGKYEVVLLANGQEVAVDGLLAHRPAQPGGS